jgi:RNA-directed DNA polymerase
METLKEKEIAIYAKANEFLQVKDIDDVAQLIQVKTESLLEIIEKSDESYYKFRIPKKRGGYREIDSPNGNLKLIQRRINYLLSVIYYGMKPACVHGFVKSVTEQNKSFSIASNATVHVKAQYVLNMDIKDFFHSVNIWRVKRVFMSYPFFFENDMAAFLALLCHSSGTTAYGGANFTCGFEPRLFLIRQKNDAICRRAGTALYKVCR